MNKFSVSENYLREVFDSLPQVVFELDHDGKIILMNRNGFELFGFTQKDIEKGASFFRIFRPQDRAAIRKDFSITTRPTRVQYTVLRKNGESFPAGIYFSPIRKGGKNTGVRAILLNISERIGIETALRESEARYRSIVDQSMVGLVMIQGRKIAFANHKMAQIMGYDRPSQMTGKDINVFLPPEAQRRAKRVTGATPHFSEYEALNRRGKKLHLRVFQKRLTVNGEPFVQAFVMDITERRDIEGKLLKRAREIDVLYRVYSHTKMIKRLSDVFHSIAKDITYAFIDPSLLQAEIVFDGKSYCFPRKKKRFILNREEPLVVAGVPRGKIRVGYVRRGEVGGGLDFLPEEIKLLENVAQILQKYMYSREIIERHKTIVHKSFTGIFIVNKGFLAYINPRFCRILGYSEADILGEPLKKLIPEYPKMADFTDGRRRETQALKKGGKAIDIALTMQPMNYHGDRVTMGSMEDITRLKTVERKLNRFNQELKDLVAEKTRHLEKANERLRSLNDLKDDFIATTSHELRSPLTSVRGYLSFLMEDESFSRIPNDLQPHLERVSDNTEALDHLINNVLDVSRVQTGRFSLQLKPFDLAKVIGRVVSGISFQASQKDINIIVRGVPKTLMVCMDHIRISQILRNLLDNAIKFSSGGDDIVLELKRASKHVTISVTDKGVGMPNSTLTRIFDKFVQVKDGNARYSGGTGLGLFITKHIVELHHGTIGVKSRPGKGSSFLVRLPINSKKI